MDTDKGMSGPSLRLRPGVKVIPPGRAGWIRGTIHIDFDQGRSVTMEPMGDSASGYGWTWQLRSAGIPDGVDRAPGLNWAQAKDMARALSLQVEALISPHTVDHTSLNQDLGHAFGVLTTLLRAEEGAKYDAGFRDELWRIAGVHAAGAEVQEPLRKKQFRALVQVLNPAPGRGLVCIDLGGCGWPDHGVALCQLPGDRWTIRWGVPPETIQGFDPEQSVSLSIYEDEALGRVLRVAEENTEADIGALSSDLRQALRLIASGILVHRWQAVATGPPQAERKDGPLLRADVRVDPTWSTDHAPTIRVTFGQGREVVMAASLQPGNGPLQWLFVPQGVLSTTFIATGTTLSRHHAVDLIRTAAREVAGEDVDWGALTRDLDAAFASVPHGPQREPGVHHDHPWWRRARRDGLDGWVRTDGYFVGAAEGVSTVQLEAVDRASPLPPVDPERAQVKVDVPRGRIIVTFRFGPGQVALTLARAFHTQRWSIWEGIPDNGPETTRLLSGLTNGQSTATERVMEWAEARWRGADQCVNRLRFLAQDLASAFDHFRAETKIEPPAVGPPAVGPTRVRAGVKVLHQGMNQGSIQIGYGEGDPDLRSFLTQIDNDEWRWGYYWRDPEGKERSHAAGGLSQDEVTDRALNQAAELVPQRGLLIDLLALRRDLGSAFAALDVGGATGTWFDVRAEADQPEAEAGSEVVPEAKPTDPKAGRKFDDGKARWDLLPWVATSEVVAVLTAGAKKYAPENWRYVPEWHWRYHAATLRHIVAWARGEKIDPETGLHHLSHAICCLMFLLELDLIEMRKVGEEKVDAQV